VAELKEVIRGRAFEFGFDVVGFARAEADLEDARHLQQYLAEGRHGDMDWMARTAERRADPKALWPEARSVICLGVNYGPAEDPRSVHGEPERGAISAYARGLDYHDLLKKRLKSFAGWLAKAHGCAVKVFVDTAPVMEKPLAMRAGLGWIGKHTNLVSRRFGSWLFLGEMFTTLELPADLPELDHCGSCDACMRACPTGALPEPYRIEPRRCISYLTIEHEGEIAPEIARAFGNRIYGCDDRLAACPWNKFAAPTPHIELRPRADLLAPKLADLADLDEAAFRARFRGTAIKRSGRDRMLRNVRLAAANAAACAGAARTSVPGADGETTVALPTDDA
jgi:epoxyqueuosine reductase